MLDAAFKALAQMFTRPFRAVLWKSIGLATVLIIVVGIGLNHLLVWLAGVAQGWAEQTLGFTTNMPVSVLAWLLSFAAALGIIAGSVLLMPAVTALRSCGAPVRPPPTCRRCIRRSAPLSRAVPGRTCRGCPRSR